MKKINKTFFLALLVISISYVESSIKNKHSAPLNTSSQTQIQNDNNYISLINFQTEKITNFFTINKTSSAFLLISLSFLLFIYGASFLKVILIVAYSYLLASVVVFQIISENFDFSKIIMLLSMGILSVLLVFLYKSDFFWKVILVVVVLGYFAYKTGLKHSQASVLELLASAVFLVLAFKLETEIFAVISSLAASFGLIAGTVFLFKEEGNSDFFSYNFMAAYLLMTLLGLYFQLVIKNEKSLNNEVDKENEDFDHEALSVIKDLDYEINS